MSNSIRRTSPCLAIAIAMLAASCMPGPPESNGQSQVVTGGGTSSAVVPGAPTGQRLYDSLAGQSVMGAAISGDTYCSYYAPDGALATVFTGFPPDYGTWTVEGAAVCETTNGNTGCSQFDFLPNGQVIVTNLEGSGSFPVTVSMASGNQCGA